jgi:hypothetical protein
MQAAQRAAAARQMSHTPQRQVTGRQMADAMQTAGLLAAPVPVVGDVAGLLGDAAMYAAKPEERTAGNALLTLLGALPFVPSVAGKAKKLLDMSDAARAQRMTEQGYTRGLWRGGRGVADRPYYTPDADMAAKFAARHGDKADVREYAIRMGKSFRLDDTFGPDDLKVFADALAPYNKAAAKELAGMATDFRGGRMPGAHLWQALKMTSGGNEQDILRALGFDTLNAGQEIITINRGTVRDANRAAFDPRQVGKVGPFLGVAGLGLLTAGSENEDSSR